MITEIKKQRIAEKLANYVARFESQSKAANSLKNVSAATINHMVNNKWQLIKEAMWLNVASQIGYNENDWQIVETRDFKILNKFFQDAQEYSNVYAITGDAGTGKTVAIRKYTEQTKNAYSIQCCEFWNRKMFLSELLQALGRDSSGYTVSEMMGEVVRTTKAIENPLLIFDEIDKASDQILYFFITLYNHLEDRCGIVLIATDHLKKRIMRGLKLNKKGYKEIYSRISRRFIELKGLSSSDITSICIANGITDRKLVLEVIEDWELDIRRIKRKIHALKNVA